MTGCFVAGRRGRCQPGGLRRRAVDIQTAHATGARHAYAVPPAPGWSPARSPSRLLTAVRRSPVFQFDQYASVPRPSVCYRPRLPSDRLSRESTTAPSTGAANAQVLPSPVARRSVRFPGGLDGPSRGARHPTVRLDFTPEHVTLRRPQTITGFVTVRNLPDSPVNLLGSRWYALDMYPGSAADGPFRITGLFSDGFAGINLAPGQSATVRVITFAPRGRLVPGYSGELIAGAHMRFLGPNDQFVDVGGLDKKLRVTVVPEPGAMSVALGALAACGVRRRVRRPR